MMDIREKLTGLVEDVNGCIIGDVTFPYQFWTSGEEYGDWCIYKSYFTDDDAAIAWFKERYPEWYAKGVEMRVYDK